MCGEWQVDPVTRGLSIALMGMGRDSLDVEAIVQVH